MRRSTVLLLALFSSAAFAGYKPPRNIVATITPDNLISSPRSVFRVQMVGVDHIFTSDFPQNPDGPRIWFNGVNLKRGTGLYIAFPRVNFSPHFTCWAAISSPLATYSSDAGNMPLVVDADNSPTGPVVQFKVDRASLTAHNSVYIHSGSPTQEWQVMRCVVSKS